MSILLHRDDNIDHPEVQEPNNNNNNNNNNNDDDDDDAIK